MGAQVVGLFQYGIQSFQTGPQKAFVRQELHVLQQPVVKAAAVQDEDL